MRPYERLVRPSLPRAWNLCEHGKANPAPHKATDVAPGPSPTTNAPMGAQTAPADERSDRVGLREIQVPLSSWLRRAELWAQDSGADQVADQGANKASLIAGSDDLSDGKSDAGSVCV